MLSYRPKKIELILHLLVWVILFTIPYLLVNDSQSMFYRVSEHIWIPLVLYGIVFYVNYLFLIEKFVFSQKYYLYLLLNLLQILFFSLVVFQIKFYFFSPLPNLPPPPEGFAIKVNTPPIRLFILKDTLWFILPIAFALTLKFFQKLKQNEMDSQEKEKSKLSDELQYLRYQLQPHFFFNSLNNIYAMVDTAPEKAKESIHSLSKLMRFLLYESNAEKISVNNEINFLITYIELMKLRYSDNTVVQYNFSNISPTVEVAPLLFITLVENAFKHGVSATQKSLIEFRLELHQNRIIFNSINTYFPKNENDKSGSGIGLFNLKKRLDLLYKNNYTFKTEIIKGRYKQVLEIQVENQSS